MSSDSLTMDYVRSLERRAEDTAKVNSDYVETLCKLSYGLRMLGGALVKIHANVAATIPIKGTKQLTHLDIEEKINQFDPVFPGITVVSDEFDNFVDESICQMYPGSARSLRTALETAVWVAEFTAERQTARSILEGWQTGLITDEMLAILSPQPALFERFQFQDNFGLRVRFGKLVEKTRTVCNPTPSGINKLYSKLSEYAHFSPGSFGNLNIARIARSSSDIESQLSSFKFREFYQYALEALDYVFLMLMKAESYYLDVAPNDITAMISEMPPKRESYQK